MVAQTTQAGPFELRISNDYTCGIDESHATLERATGGICKRVSVQTGLPLRRDESCFTLEAGFGLCSYAAMQSAVDDREDRTDEHYY